MTLGYPLHPLVSAFLCEDEMKAALKDLIGKIMVSIENKDSEEIIFTANDGRRFKLYHDSRGCEIVTVEDIISNLSDLVGSPFLMAEEETSTENPEGITKGNPDSFTWTFYKFATVK